MKNVFERAILDAADAITRADAIFISAGAGMGVDSGLPDFRGNKGFWNAYPLLGKENLSFQDLADPSWFRNNPQRAWGFYGHRFKLYQVTTPHEGFNILQRLSGNKNIGPFVFTSNVDGHFQKSGFDADSVYECHGSINFLQCSECCTDAIWPLAQLDIEIDEERLLAVGELPTCWRCSAVARPNILMFADAAWLSKRAEIQHRNFDNWKTRIAATANTNTVTIELGAGKAIPTARYASESMSGKLVRINPRDPDGYGETISIPLGALEGLLAIDSALTVCA